MNATIRQIVSADYDTTRWSGGTTTQIAISPAGACYPDRDFLWRVSSATVELDASDFTPLPDYERFLSTLQGSILVSHDGGTPLTLTPGNIHRFDGGAATRSEGICTDFNLMLRKGKCSGEMRCLHLGEHGAAKLSRTVALERERYSFLVYCVEGDGELSLDGETVRFSKGEAVLAQKGEPLLRSGGASVFMLCEMTETES
ncbi:HutD/Ves family protein [Oscillibacter ruminantium]|uniref:HutD/Ves family protein n=1 Tax=Oscillibacter ruminantium TaxID=1263547 RepID=UPI0002D5AF97|nr:HutD family protein [Oscillibacter ruminantium]